MNNSTAPIHPELKDALNIVNQPDPYEENKEGLATATITIGSVEGPLDKNIESKNKAVLFEAIKRGWDTFHRYFVYILIALFIGVYCGVTASKIFFANKMEDTIKIGGMVFKEKVYVILPK
jgi:hypothetical protein